jgi:putative endonuclease
MFTVYAIKSEDKDRIYVWMTTNLERRLSDHNRWYNKSTKAYRPFKILLKEKYWTSLEARTREKYYKSWIWKEKLKLIVAGLSTDR